MKTMVKLWAIVRVSLLEMLGHPIALLLTFASAMWVLALPMLQFQRFSEDGRMARDCGLAMAFLFGLIFVISNASRLTRTLSDGTAAAVFVKPISRGFWIFGNCLGGILAMGVFLVVQVAVVMLAETFSPTYRLNGAYANVPALFYSMGVLSLPLLLGALNQCFLRGRFTLTALLLMPLFVWGEVFIIGVTHLWGILTGGLAIFLGLIQIAAVATAIATRCTSGLTTLLSTLFVLVWAYGLNGVAYLQLDALSMGGAISCRTLVFLLPQTVAVMGFALWGATGLLRHRAIS